MQPRHWERLNGILGKTVNHLDPKFCLRDLYNLELYKYRSEVEDVCFSADMEALIRRKLD